MKLENLKPGMCVDLRVGTFCIVVKDNYNYNNLLVNLKTGKEIFLLKHFDDNMRCKRYEKAKENKLYDIVRVYSDFTKLKMYWEREVKNDN